MKVRVKLDYSGGIFGDFTKDLMSLLFNNNLLWILWLQGLNFYEFFQKTHTKTT